MNQAKLCGLIVLLCVICPVMVGYAWPVNAEDETIYNVQNTTNITKDFTNGKINTYAEFTDVYANNYNMFANIDGDLLPIIGATWSETSGLPLYNRYPASPGFTADDSGKYTNTISGFIDDLRTRGIIANNSAVLVVNKGTWSGILVDGVSVTALVYYLQNDTMQIIKNNELQSSSATSITFTGGTAGQIYRAGVSDMRAIQNRYADVAYGFELYDSNNTSVIWSNGYSNQRIDILLKTDYDMDLKIDIPRVASLEWHVYISEDGQIKFRYPGSTAKILGDVETYPYVLLRIDAYNQKISLSGLIGMQSFTDPYESLMRHTIEADLSLRAITHLTFTNQNESVPIHYFIPKTISSITSVDGINAAVQNLRGYTGEDFQIQFKMPQFVSSGNGAIDFGPIEGVVNDNDKTITWTVGTKTVTAPIKDTYLLSIGRDLYINGEMMYSYPSYQSEILLKFYGQWLMQLYYSDLDSDTKPSYTWLPGGFGLNEVGFCVVGLMTAAGSGTAAMLAGRRSGTKAGLALLVAGCCGAFYILEIMNFM